MSRIEEDISILESPVSGVWCAVAARRMSIFWERSVFFCAWIHRLSNNIRSPTYIYVSIQAQVTQPNETTNLKDTYYGSTLCKPPRNILSFLIHLATAVSGRKFSVDGKDMRYIYHSRPKICSKVIGMKNGHRPRDTRFQKFQIRDFLEMTLSSGSWTCPIANGSILTPTLLLFPIIEQSSATKCRYQRS
jgi:hypothetical protein